MTEHQDKKKECCPPFDPALWDGKIVEWQNKRFIKDKVCTLFYMPLNFGCKMKMLDKKIRNADAVMLDGLCLADHTSQWNMDLLLAVDKEIPDAEIIFLSGRFFSKVYEGAFRDTGKWCKDFENTVVSQGMKIPKYFMWYTTCPKCAKKYGKNYVVIIGQVEY